MLRVLKVLWSSQGCAEQPQQLLQQFPLPARATAKEGTAATFLDPVPLASHCPGPAVTHRTLDMALC